MPTITTAPWGPQQPYLQSLWGGAQDLYGQGGPQFYPGSLTAGFDPAQTEAMGMTEQTARAGQPVIPSYQNMLTKTYQGGFLPGQQSNPFIDAMFRQAARPVTDAYRESVAPSIGAQAGSAGRYGSGLYQNMMGRSQGELGRELGGLAANLYGRSYEAERDRMYRGDPATAAALGYFDAEKLAGVGLERQTQEQRLINEAQARHQFGQERPWDVLGRYQAAIEGPYGAEKETPTDKFARDIGRATAGANLIGILQDIFNPPTCHVARLVFGAENPEWVMFYFWKEYEAPKWFRDFYNRNSEVIAGWLKGKSILQGAIRSWMRTKIKIIADKAGFVE